MLAAFEAACCAANGVPLRDPRKPSDPELFQDRTLPFLIGDGHDRVVEGRLHVAQSMRNVLALLLLECFLLALLIGPRAARCCWFCHSSF